MRLNPGTFWTRTVELRSQISAKCKLIGIVRTSDGLLLAAVVSLFIPSPVQAQSPTFAGNPQHTANYAMPAQHLHIARWTTSVDLDNGGPFAHYGAPLVTSSNTVIVPVRTAT